MDTYEKVTEFLASFSSRPWEETREFLAGVSGRTPGKEAADFARRLLDRYAPVTLAEADRAWSLLVQGQGEKGPDDPVPQHMSKCWIVGRPDTPSTGYDAGGTGYGWLGYVAGERRPATLKEFVEGRALTEEEAAKEISRQERRQESNERGFRAYLNA